MRLAHVIAAVVVWGACSSHDRAPSAPPAGPPASGSSASGAPSTPAPPPGACERDDDCEIHCPSAPGCCADAPCGCRMAIAKREEAADDADLATRCQRVDCKRVDCARPPELHAACVAHQCETVPDVPPDAMPAPPPDAMPAPPPDAAPAPKPVHASSADPTACGSAADCEIHCPVAAGCCDPAPCGCREAINRTQEKQIDRAYGRSCERKRCPIVDCKLDNAMGADCVAGHCAPRNGPGGPSDPF